VMMSPEARVSVCPLPRLPAPAVMLLSYNLSYKEACYLTHSDGGGGGGGGGAGDHGRKSTSTAEHFFTAQEALRHRALCTVQSTVTP
jgi:hypothetical protein